MNATKSLNHPAATSESKALIENSNDETEYGEYNAGSDYGMEVDPDAYFEDDSSWESDGAEAEPELSAAGMREQLKSFAADLKANPDLSPEQRESLIHSFMTRINKAAGMNGEAQQAAFFEIQMDMDASLQSLPEATALGGEIDSLIGEIEQQELPAQLDDKKQQWIEDLKKAKPGLDLNLEDSSAIEELVDQIRSEFEDAKGAADEQQAALNAPIDNLLGYLQSKGDTTSTAESLKQALSESGLSLEDLQNISLPTSAATHAKLFQFISKADPRFAQMLAENAGNPFAEEVVSRFTEVLSQILPAGSLTPDNVQKILKDCGLDAFPAAGEIGKRIVDSNSGMEAKSFAHAVDEAVASGNWEAVNTTFVGLSGETGNDMMRKFITALYDAVGGDEEKFQQALDRIPSTVRESMAKIAYATWVERSEKHDGDRWNSSETYEIIYNSIYN